MDAQMMEYRQTLMTLKNLRMMVWCDDPIAYNKLLSATHYIEKQFVAYERELLAMEECECAG